MNKSKSKIGELLLSQGLIDEDQLEHALAEHARTGMLLGRILVRLNMVSEEDMNSILGTHTQLREKKKIGDILLERGYIDQEQLETALEEQKRTGSRLGHTIMNLGYIDEERLIEVLSDQLEILRVKLEEFKIDESVIELIPEEMCRQYKMMPLYQKDNAITVAISDPSNLRNLDYVRFKLHKPIEAVLSSEKEIMAAIDKYYGSGRNLSEMLDDIIGDEYDELEVVEEEQEPEIQLTSEEGLKVAQTVKNIIETAVIKKASDIHFEPQENALKVRYRIDGVLAVATEITPRLMPQMLSRIKLLSKMDIAERRKPQDGRFTLKVKGKEVDLRVSSFPVILRKKGVQEKIVIRILDPNSGQIALAQMGLQESVYKSFLHSINLPNGIILVTGPTGSGKSTTLYSSIREIRNDSVNITTMEDPVELNLTGINQGQINNQAGFSFAAGIRAILRQDPDVIMIGEMRDKETAMMAIESALTGHLVFSTLHTNDSPGAFPRLLEMGLEPFLIATAVKGVLAQRLVRRICSSCKEETEISKELRESLAISKDAVFYQGKGCPKCDNSGYKGRLGIYEYLVPNDPIRQLIVKRASGAEIKNAALKAGMITLRMDGMEKALAGITTLEQVLASSESDDD